jgi:Kef-type K+ transport system membrane component KefB
MLLTQLVHVEHPAGPALPFLVLFVVIVAGPLIIEKFRLPGIIGLLLGGFIIGPHCTGLIGSGNTTVPDLGQIGLLYLMFVAGLELDLRLVNAHRKQTLVYSAMTFTFPMVAGIVAGLSIGFSGLAAVLLGSLLASHTLVVYPMIREMGRGNDPAVATGVGATVVTDTLTLIVLAVVSGLTVGQAGTFDIVAQVVLGLVILGVGSFIVLPRLARLVLHHFGTARATRYGVAFISMLAAAALAETFAIEGIVGAFFAGLALNRLVPNEGDLMERIEFFGGAVFIPIFLVSVGLIVDPSVMIEPETLRLAAIFILACFGGKLLAAVLAHPLLDFGWAEVGILFALTIPQAAATLAATIVGFDIGLFGTNVVNAVLVLIAVSLILSAVITPVFARRLDIPVEGLDRLGRRVLLVIDADKELRRGVAVLACRLAAADDGIVVPVVVASDNFRPPHAQHPPNAMLVSLGIDRTVEHFIDQTIAEGVRHAARSYRCTSVVIDDLDGTIHDQFVGSLAEQPVLFVGKLNPSELKQAFVDVRHERDGVMHNLAGRLARAGVSVANPTGADLVVQPAGTDEPDFGDRDVTFVRVFAADEARGE